MPGEDLLFTDRTAIPSDDEDADTRSDRFSSQGSGPQFRRGQLVRHRQFGLGRIAEVTDMGQHTLAIVEFNTAGRKTLILQYANLKPPGQARAISLPRNMAQRLARNMLRNIV